jgi:hypothetical protein
VALVRWRVYVHALLHGGLRGDAGLADEHVRRREVHLWSHPPKSVRTKRFTLLCSSGRGEAPGRVAAGGM